VKDLAAPCAQEQRNTTKSLINQKTSQKYRRRQHRLGMAPSPLQGEGWDGGRVLEPTTTITRPTTAQQSPRSMIFAQPPKTTAASNVNWAVLHGGDLAHHPIQQWISHSGVFKLAPQRHQSQNTRQSKQEEQTRIAPKNLPRGKIFNPTRSNVAKKTCCKSAVVMTVTYLLAH